MQDLLKNPKEQKILLTLEILRSHLSYPSACADRTWHLLLDDI